MSSTIYMGFDGTINIAGCTAFRNVKLTVSGTEVDITTNKDGGYKMYAKGLIDRAINAELDTSDSSASSVVAALKSRAGVSCSISIGGVSESFTGLVFAGDIGGTLDDAVWIPVTVRPTRVGASGSSPGTDPANPGGDDSSSSD